MASASFVPADMLFVPILFNRIRHRGPDWSGTKTFRNHIMCHERLAIVGLDSGAQPIVSDDGALILCVNGEIYNHKSLYTQLVDKRRRESRKLPVLTTDSDCEIILHLVWRWFRRG